MAEQFDSVTPDIGAADANNPYGTFLDEDAGIPGTPILAGWKNTIKAFMERLMIRTGKTFDGNPDEAAGIAQIYDAFDEVTTGDDSLLAVWAAATFNQDDVIRHGGKQWFVGVASTIEIPGPNSEWAKSKTFDKYLELATEKGPELGGFLPLNNIRDLTNYAAYFRMGKFDWNAGKWEAWRVNVDGGAHVSGTSDVAKLLSLSKFASEVILSDTAGTLTLEDYRGRVAASVDPAGGNRPDIGKTKEDAMQRITGTIDNSVTGSGSVNGVFTEGGSSAVAGTGATLNRKNITFNSANSISPNPAKTDAEETYMKHYSEGISGIVCIVPEGTI